MLNNNIYSLAAFSIEAYGKCYGYFTAEILSLEIGRIWQQLDLDVFLSFVHNLALILAKLDNKE